MDSSDFDPPPHHPMKVLSKQAGATVTLIGNRHILKTGDRVFPREGIAMGMVRDHTSILVLTVLARKHEGERGGIRMTYIAGTTLDTCWSTLHDSTMQAICNELWNMVEQLRQILKPPQWKS